jgi:hypothetical protein
VALRGASGRPRGSVLGENVTSQVTFSPLAWRRACFATASPATVTTLRSLCVPFAARTRGTARAGRGWTAFAATMAVNAVHPPGQPGHSRRKTPRASRLSATLLCLGALRRAAPPAIEDDQGPRSRAPVAARGRQRAMTGGAGRPTPPGTAHHGRRWPSICGHRLRSRGIAPPQSTRRDGHHPRHDAAKAGTRRGRHTLAAPPPRTGWGRAPVRRTLGRSREADG